MNKKSLPATSILILALIFCTAGSLFLGAQHIDVRSFFEQLLEVLRGNQQVTDSFESVIILQLRLPRALLCILCGALLGGSGSVLQGYFRNPLADSGILGISSGATLGAILAGCIGGGSLATMGLKFFAPVSLFAFAGGIFTGLLIFSFSFLFKSSSGTTLLLAGTAAGTFISSICSLILLTQTNIRGILSWTMGSFSAKGWYEITRFIIPALISLIMLFFTAPSLDILGSGEKTAISLGLNIRFTKLFVLAATSLATSCAVCCGGIISFVGLIAPHIVRMLFTSRHKILIPLSMLTGSIILLISDTLARTIAAPTEIPVGIITSLIGVPFFVFVLRKNHNV